MNPSDTKFPIIKLGSLAPERGAFVDGPFGSNLKASEYVQRGVPLIRIQNVRPNHFEMQGRQFIPEWKAAELSRHNYCPGDLVIAKMGSPAGDACIVPTEAGNGIVVADVVRFRGQSNLIDHQYLAYYLNSEFGRTEFLRRTRGSTRQRVNLSEMKQIDVPVPGIVEQRRIAAILDKAESVYRKRQEMLAQTDELLRSTFLEMFGHPARTPEAHPVLSDIAEIARGRFSPRPRNDPKYYGGKYPFVQTGEIASADGYLGDYRQTLNEQGIKVSKSFPIGTVFVAIVGATIGETAVTSREFWCPDSVIGIIPRTEKAPAEFIEYLLRFWRPIFLAKAPETARANINLQTLKPIPVPGLDTQKPVVFARLYRQAYDLKRSLNLMGDDLLSALSQRAFRGEL